MCHQRKAVAVLALVAMLDVATGLAQGRVDSAAVAVPTLEPWQAAVAHWLAQLPLGHQLPTMVAGRLYGYTGIWLNDTPYI